MTTLSTDSDSYTSTTPGEDVYGIDGNDTLTASDGGNALYGGTGNDVLNGGLGDDLLSSDDSTADEGLNVMNGGGGSDTLLSYSWYDQVSAGAGDDQVQVFAQQTGQNVDGGSGNDLLYLLALSSSGFRIYVDFASTFAPQVDGIAGASYQNFERLYIIGSTAGNTFLGGGGDDWLINSFTNVSSFAGGKLNGRGGSDYLEVNGLTQPGTGIETVDGGGGSDIFQWSNGTANGFDLSVDGPAGEMRAGGTTFLTFQRIEKLQLTTYAGFSGAIDYTGISGVDYLQVSAASSSLSLGAGDDYAQISLGVATVNGGAGNDAISRFGSGPEASFFYGGSGNDTLSGGYGQSTLDGGDGNDRVSSYNKLSLLLGQAGDDILYLSQYSTSGTGHGTVDGGTGRDLATLELSAFAGAFNADFRNATVTLADGTVVVNCEGIIFSGGTGNDTLRASNDIGGVATNQLLGNVGDDKLSASLRGAKLDGGAGNDRLTGAAGADSLLGSLGDDRLTGGDGADTLAGGYGIDRLSGGGGADLFVFVSPGETTAVLGTADTILDFSRAEGDRIDIHTFALYGTGLPAMQFIGHQGFHNVKAEVRYQQFNLAGTAQDHTQIMGDQDGNGTADWIIDCAGLITFRATDLILG